VKLFAHYWFWVPVVVLVYVIYSLLSKQNQEHGGKWFWAMYAFGVIMPWAFVSRYSKNLLFDGLLYDMVMCCTMAATFAVLGEGANFTGWNWVGVGLALCGFAMMKV